MADGADDADRPLTAADLQPLLSGLDELRQRFDDLDEAETPADRSAAAGEIADVKEDLAATAKRLGISPEALKQSISSARAAERKEEIKPILAELLEELKAAVPDPPDGDVTPPAKPKARPKPELVPDPDDSGPVVEHWMEKGIGTLLGR